MHVERMTIGGIPPFTDTVEFDLDERVNLFIGPNATGKSTILRKLASKTPEDSKFGFELSADWPESPLRYNPRLRRPSTRRRVNGGQTHRVTHATDNLAEVVDSLPWIYIPSTRHTLPLSDDRVSMQNLQASSWDTSPDRERAITGLDVSRILSDSSYLFDGNSIRQACKAITDRFRMKRTTEPEFLRQITVKNIAHTCAQNVCSDVLLEGQAPQDYIHRQPLEGPGITITNVYDDMSVSTADSKGVRLFAGDLSSGTQATLLWIWHLALKMAAFYDYQPGWQSLPAILLIDEIENNLHPTWQRRVIPALLETFEGLQIFATTHSPFVIAGRSAGQVHRLYRDVEGRLLSESPNEADIVGWTADEILRTMMGVDDPTDKSTADAAAELRDLRRIGRSGDAEEEEQRQQRIRELEPLVDRDLLAGGPAAAQRDLFEQQFAEALDKYRQSRDLEQETD